MTVGTFTGCKLRIFPRLTGTARTRTGGFTLIELLLVVVAIIAILASLILPSLSQAKTKAKNAKCQSQLRQISLGLAMYVTDHGRYPYGITLDATTVITKNNASYVGFGGWWHNRLEPYLSASWTNALYICPFNTLRPPYLVLAGPGEISYNAWQGSYGYNTSGTDGRNQWRQGVRLGLGDAGMSGTPQNVPSLSDAEIRAPSEMIMVGDAFYGSSRISPFRVLDVMAMIADRPDLPRELYHPHSEGVNMAFCDGHLRFMKDAEAYGANETARRRWNCDNEPHPETW